MSELNEFLSYNTNPPSVTGEIKELIDNDRKMLAGEFFNVRIGGASKKDYYSGCFTHS